MSKLPAGPHGLRGVAVNTASIAAFEGQIGQVRVQRNDIPWVNVMHTLVKCHAQYMHMSGTPLGNPVLCSMKNPTGLRPGMLKLGTQRPFS